MKKITLLLFTIILYKSGYAQDFNVNQIRRQDSLLRAQENLAIRQTGDSVLAKINVAIAKAKEVDSLHHLMIQKNFNYFFKNKFSQIAYQKDEIPLGNSASVVAASNNTRLNFNFMKGFRMSAIGLGSELNYDGSTAKIFSDKNVLSNTSYFANGFFLFKSEIRYRGTEQELVSAKRDTYLDKIKRKYISFYNNYAIAKQTIHDCDSILSVIASHCKDSMTCNFRIEGDTLRFRILKDTITVIQKEAEAKLRCNCCQDKLCHYFSMKDSLLEAKSDALETLSEYKDIKNAATEIEARMTKVNEYVSDVETKANYTRYSTWWFGWEGKYTKENYKIFNAADLRNYTIDMKNFDRYKITASINYFIKRSKALTDSNFGFLKSFYFTLAYTGSNDNNYANIDEKKLSVTTSVQQNDTLTTYQISEQSLRDVSGINFKKSWAHSLNFTTIIGISDNDLVGISLGIRGNYSLFSVPEYTPKLGLVLKFLDNEKTDKSKVTFEVFASLENAFEKNGEKSSWEKFQIGLNTKIPLSKILF